jgi:hypothetical protein
MKVDLFDGDGHAVGVEPHRHVKFIISRNGHAISWRGRKGNDARGGIDRPAGCLQYACQIYTLTVPATGLVIVRTSVLPPEE